MAIFGRSFPIQPHFAKRPLAIAIGNIYSGSVAEGSATAVDAQSTISTLLVTSAEIGSAVDAPAAGLVYATVVAEGPHNLLLYTDQFDNAAWQKFNASITADSTTAPDGSSTADSLVDTNINSTHGFLQSVSNQNAPNGNYTSSVYVKAGSKNWLYMYFADGGGWIAKFFDLVNGITGSSAGSGGSISLISSAISSVGNGWYRCSIVGNTTNPSTLTLNCYVAVSDGVLAYTGGPTTALYFWGAQIESGALTQYQSIAGTLPTFAADTESVTAVFSGVVAEAGAAADTEDAVKVGGVSTVVEGSATAADTETAQAAFFATDAEGSSTATDASSSIAVWVAAMVEGSATAVDTESVIAAFSASAVEGLSTSVDTPSAIAALVAAAVEGSATAADAQNASMATSAAAVEGSATATDAETAAAVFISAIAESGAATDTPTASFTVGATIAEAGAATDSPNAPRSTPATVAEGSATAADTESAQLAAMASIAESGAAFDTPTAGTSTPTAIAEAGAATDTETASAVFAASVAEGSSTSVDTPSAAIAGSVTSVNETGNATDTPSATAAITSSVAETSLSSVDVQAAANATAASLAELASLVDALPASHVLAAAIAEGGATASDTLDATKSFSSVDVSEGSATATDAYNAVIISHGSIDEGTATAADLASAGTAWAAFIAEGSATAADVSSSSVSLPQTFVYLDPRYGTHHRKNGDVKHAAQESIAHRKPGTVEIDR